MSDQITINVVPDSFVTVTAEEGNENVYLNPITLNQGIINHSTTHASGGSDELLHNALGGLNGGTSGQFYHLTSQEYSNLVTGQVIRPSDTGLFYASSNPSGFITGVDLTNYVTGDVVRPNETGAFYASSNPSGFITGINDIVYTTGNQNISGLKNFYTRPQVNGIGVLLSGEGGGGGSASGDYLPLSGGTLTGDLYLQQDPDFIGNRILNVEGMVAGIEIYSPQTIYTDFMGMTTDNLYFVNTTTTYINWVGQSRIYNSSNGVIKLTNSTNNNFSRLQFGGVTAAFPAIKRNGSGIDVVNATDTAFSDLRANNTNFNNISGNACTLSGNLLVNTNSLFVNASTDRVGIGTASPTEKLTVLGNITGSGSVIINNDFESIDSTKGVILKAPNGSRFRITIDNSGALNTTAL